MTHSSYADLRRKLDSVQQYHNRVLLDLMSTNTVSHEILHRPVFLVMKGQIDSLEVHMLDILNKLTQMISQLLSTNDSADTYTAAFQAFFDLDTWVQHYESNVEYKIRQYITLIQRAQ